MVNLLEDNDVSIVKADPENKHDFLNQIYLKCLNKWSDEDDQDHQMSLFDSIKTFQDGQLFEVKLMDCHGTLFSLEKKSVATFADKVKS
jgi:hypothetical protein